MTERGVRTLAGLAPWQRRAFGQELQISIESQSKRADDVFAVPDVLCSLISPDHRDWLPAVIRETRPGTCIGVLKKVAEFDAVEK